MWSYIAVYNHWTGLADWTGLKTLSNESSPVAFSFTDKYYISLFGKH